MNALQWILGAFLCTCVYAIQLPSQLILNTELTHQTIQTNGNVMYKLPDNLQSNSSYMIRISYPSYQPTKFFLQIVEQQSVNELIHELALHTMPSKLIDTAIIRFHTNDDGAIQIEETSKTLQEPVLFIHAIFSGFALTPRPTTDFNIRIEEIQFGLVSWTALHLVIACAVGIVFAIAVLKPLVHIFINRAYDTAHEKVHMKTKLL